MAPAPWDDVAPHDQFFALVTGANSGIGLAIPQRMIQEFLASRPRTSHLIVIVTTRSPRKSAETIAKLRVASHKFAQFFSQQSRSRSSAEETIARVHLLSLELDLLKLPSVVAAADKLVNGALSLDNGKEKKEVRIPRLDSIIFNAGLGGWTGVNWLKAFRDVLTSWTQSLTWPGFKMAEAGNVVDPLTGKISQLPGIQLKADPNSPAGELDDNLLGMVFCGNVFGHYLFAHRLLPLLRRNPTPGSSTPPLPPARIIWESSLEAVSAANFNPADFQGIRTPAPYESSKRMTDVLALTSNLPGVRPYSASFFVPDDNPEMVPPRMLTVHPGLVPSGFFPCPPALYWAYVLVMYITLWLGSPWHTITPWNGAAAAVWVALREESALVAEKGDKTKWGSMSDRLSRSGVKRTEVEGWGWDGEVDGKIAAEETGLLARSVGRKYGTVDVSKESIEEFEVLGAEIWKEMERLKVKWEERLG